MSRSALSGGIKTGCSFALAICALALLCGGDARATDRDWLFGGPGIDGARKMLRTASGSYLVGGWRNQVGIHDGGEGALLLVDANGRAAWDLTLSTTGRNQVSAIMERAQGGALAVVEEYPNARAEGQVVIVEVDAAGRVVTRHAVGGPGSDVADTIVPTVDGGYALAGESAATGHDNMDAWLVKLSATFEIEWQWREGGADRDRFNDLIVTRDGNLLAAGNRTTDGKSDAPLMVKYSSSGEVLWNRHITDLGKAASIRSVVETADGDLVVAGFSNATDGSFDSWIARFDRDGRMRWERTVAAEFADYLFDVTTAPGGGFLAAGAIQDRLRGPFDALVIAFDAAGAVNTTRRHGGPRSEQARAITAIDGGYVVAGQSRSEDKADEQIWLYEALTP